MAAGPKIPSLYTRMQAHGTLTEAPRDVPDARFALPSTIHWMRALAILTADQNVDFAASRAFYAKVQARSVPDRELNTVCEQLLFVLNQIAALRALTSAANKADVARTAIVASHYGVYSAASAMTASMDGSFQDNHTETARRFPSNHLAMPPFADCLSSVLPATTDAELAPVRARGRHSLLNAPSTAQDTWGCCAEYLWDGGLGTMEHRGRETGAFKALGASDFRKKAARDLRDAAYARRGIAFLHQASRYRGKANYRDAIFLAYGNSVPIQLSGFIDDLLTVLKAFAAMAGAYCSLRIGKVAWTDFIDDLDRKKAISVSPKDIW
jgi:hypothetical protein